MRHPPRGFMMIEALIAILIFCLGILGMVAMGGAAIGAQSDAQYRTDAAKWADNLAAEIALTVDRGIPAGAVLPASLASFAHQTAGANCVFSGATSPNSVVANWISDLSSPSVTRAALPGATSASQQVKVDSSAAAFNRVEITLCWKAPADAAMRSHTLVTYIN